MEVKITISKCELSHWLITITQIANNLRCDPALVTTAPLGQDTTSCQEVKPFFL